jgi:hypothetical protein
VVSEISESSISMIRPIKESIPKFSQSAHARVDRNRETTDFTYLTHLLCCPPTPAFKKSAPAWPWASRQRWTGRAQNRPGGMVISASAEGLRARRRSNANGRRLEEIFPKQVHLTGES